MAQLLKVLVGFTVIVCLKVTHAQGIFIGCLVAERMENLISDQREVFPILRSRGVLGSERIGQTPVILPNL